MSGLLIWLVTEMMSAIIQDLAKRCLSYAIENRQVIWKYTTTPLKDGVKWSKTAFEDISSQASQISQQGWKRHNQAFEWSKTAFEDISSQASQISQQGWKRHDQAVETLFSSCQWRFN